MMNVLIVCHAGAGMGLGHLVRSVVVAHALRQELGANVQLLIQGDSIRRPDLDVFAHRFLRCEENLLFEVRLQAQQINAKVVVFDLHPGLVPADIGELLTDLRRDNRKVISVDGLRELSDRLDMLFIPSFQFTPRQDSPENTLILWGWDCFLLNVYRLPGEFQPGQHVLVMTGGSDATGLGKTLPTQLDAALLIGTELHWVTGPYAEAPDLPSFPRLTMLNHVSPCGLDNLMINANYAVTVYGVGFFELLYYGVPTVVFSPYGNKDDNELAAIAQEGVALVAKDERDAVGKLIELMADARLAASLSQHARHRMSILGGQKFAKAVAQL